MKNNKHIIDFDQNIKRKTFFLRYEDIARRPIKYAKDIYEFIGEEFNEKIEKVINNTLVPPKKELSESKATYSTSRAINTTQVKYQWYYIDAVFRRTYFLYMIARG